MLLLVGVIFYDSFELSDATDGVISTSYLSLDVDVRLASGKLFSPTELLRFAMHCRPQVWAFVTRCVHFYSWLYNRLDELCKRAQPSGA